jgi:uncharacterized GH25 family protein
MISGQAMNIGSSTLKNVQVTAHFYDSNAKNVGGIQTEKVSPTTLKADQKGTFNIKAPTNKMSGIASFLRLEYDSTSSSSSASSSAKSTSSPSSSTSHPHTSTSHSIAPAAKMTAKK